MYFFIFYNFWWKRSMKLTTSVFSGNRDCVMVISEVEREHEGMWKCTLIGPGVKAQNHFFELKLTNLQDCTWGNWQPWSSCSKSCGRGQRSRRRRKFRPATGGGKDCLETTTEAEFCNDQSCKTNNQGGQRPPLGPGPPLGPNPSDGT